MMHIPEILKPYLKAGKELIRLGLVREIEFSGGTYQIQVFDETEKNEVWAFLQLDKKNILKDCFCSCHESEDVACPHITASYLRIFNNKEKPLHERFELSLWNKLCRLYSERFGDDRDKLTLNKKNRFELKAASGKTIFYIEGKSKDAITKLSHIILERHSETEETSLKFSNLSQEEILLWKEGKPTEELKYELSFWNDLAKWFKTMQEMDNPYKISFETLQNGIPSFVHVKFEEVEFGFYLSAANLPLIIPSLSTVDSPLKVHLRHHLAVKKITYDKVLSILKIESKESDKKQSGSDLKIKNGTPVGNWIFVPLDGFYPAEDTGLLSKSEILTDEIPVALSENLETIKSCHQGFVIHDEKVDISYHLFFDNEWNLHVNSFVFNKGDLEKPYSKDFKNWVYLDNDGFYKVEKRAFDAVSQVILKDDVTHFILKYRNFFNAQDGFKIYVTNVEAELQYNLSAENTLSFVRQAVLKDISQDESFDFGILIYVKGQGFYTKISPHIGLPVRGDITISKDQIPLFIRMHKQDLEHVPGFFSQTCPVLKSGINISLIDEKTISILPQYDLKPGYSKKKVLYFDDFCFVENEGFHELPFDSRLPEEYHYPVEISKERLPYFLNYELEKLIPFATHVDAALLKPEFIKLEALKVSKAENNLKGFYSLNLVIVTEKGMISVVDIWSAIKKKKAFLFHPFGMVDLKLEEFDWLRHIDKTRVDKKNDTILLSTLEFIRLNAFHQIEIYKGKEGVDLESLSLLEELTDFKTPNPPDLTGLNSHLRAYQQIGVNWLWFLHQHSLSGLLSDDMGLGKTHQTMGLVASVMNYHKALNNGKKQFLIVCPTSVIYHWEEKLMDFLPNAKVFVFHGTARDLNKFHEDYDILLTSYGILRNENEILSKIPFEVAIFDEIQIAKNHNSRIYASLKNVQAEMRIGLTGTPIENYLRELKTLFDIVVPSYMPQDAVFRELFVKPIEKEKDDEKRALLTRFIKPFLLRRKKTQVLLDLPEKIEEVAHIELEKTQEELYKETLENSRKKIIDDLKNDQKPIPYMHIFALLSALKQICDHPAVFLKCPEDYKKYASGKWELFKELLNEARESEQKVVIFSQYLSMLDIIEEYLKENHIGYATIRGSTANRGEQIQRFNKDPKCEVFVGSLQASGLGVDLTAGSVVIHYDRWWNAARENQATDRVHRIGQTRGVQVFKLVTKNTIEEKIDRMISRKGKLMEEVVTVDDHQLVKQFDRHELIELLQYVAPTE